MSKEKVFIDTSAFYALMDRADICHARAKKLWHILLNNGTSVVTSNYISIKTMALLQNRLGFEAANLWYSDILGIVKVIWANKIIHKTAYDLWVSFGRRKLSLVDCTSFVIMNKYRISKVFGFDKHFIEQGFIQYDS